MHATVWALCLGMAFICLAWGAYGFDGLLGCWINNDERWRCQCDYSNVNATGSSEQGLTYLETPEGGPDLWGCYGPPESDFQWEYPYNRAMNQSAEDCLECYVCPDAASESRSSLAVILFAEVPVGLCIGIVLISMMVLFWTVRKTEQRTSRWNFPGSSNLSTNTGRSPLSQRAMETGLLYSGALILTFIPSLVNGFSSHGTTLEQVMQILVVTLLPLQGFSNMLIYTSDRWLPVVKEHCCGCNFRLCGRNETSQVTNGGSSKRSGGTDDTISNGSNILQEQPLSNEQTRAGSLPTADCPSKGLDTKDNIPINAR